MYRSRRKSKIYALHNVKLYAAISIDKEAGPSSTISAIVLSTVGKCNLQSGNQNSVAYTK